MITRRSVLKLMALGVALAASGCSVPKCGTSPRPTLDAPPEPTPTGLVLPAAVPLPDSPQYRIIRMAVEFGSDGHDALSYVVQGQNLDTGAWEVWEVMTAPGKLLTAMINKEAPKPNDSL